MLINFWEEYLCLFCVVFVSVDVCTGVDDRGGIADGDRIGAAVEDIVVEDGVDDREGIADGDRIGAAVENRRLTAVENGWSAAVEDVRDIVEDGGVYKMVEGGGRWRGESSA